MISGGVIMHKKLYNALHKAHDLIRERKFKKASYFYYWIEKKYNRLSRKAKQKEAKLHHDIEKLHDEVRLYLMVDNLHKKISKGNAAGIRHKMHEVTMLANKVARQVPGDRALYSYAKSQYEYCKKLLEDQQEKEHSLS